MAELRISEADAARDLHALLHKVRQGLEVVIEKDNQPAVIMRTPAFEGVDLDACIAALRAAGSHAVPDDEFAADLLAAIDAHREPLDPPVWD